MYAARFRELGAGDVGSAGGKGASLGELTRAGMQVPPGFVVTTDAFHATLSTVDADGTHRGRVGALDPDNLEAVHAVCVHLRELIASAPVPARVADAVMAHYRELDPGGELPAVAVRSSATLEDAAAASFAGLQDTYLWVRGGQAVLEHLRRCWASLYNAESVSYRLRRRLPEQGLAMGVVVQRMVEPRCAGVMFTRSPLTGDRSVVAIEAAWGLGSALVSGDVTPDSIVVNKVTGEVLRRTIGTKLRRHRMDPAGTGVLDEPVPEQLQQVCCLTDEQVGELVAVARRIEAHFGAAQDIEWAIADGGVHVLQSRPETIWSGRAAVPVAPVRDSAFAHVLDVLGGRRENAS
ncbi:MAG: PEP/pyruvate-binding domain-containing protein [Micromonosporaceae bacterium]|nr:PEP/pyruvate-binding domain-containing protein [Micromonosporaceae bacterium]